MITNKKPLLTRMSQLSWCLTLALLLVGEHTTIFIRASTMSSSGDIVTRMRGSDQQGTNNMPRLDRVAERKTSMEKEAFQPTDLTNKLIRQHPQQQRMVAGNTTSTLGSATEIYNTTVNTFTDTIETPPSQWQQKNWIVVSVTLAILICLFGCVWKMLPCTPRIC